MVGMSSHHIQTTRDFVEQIKDICLQQDESIISFDVTALLTSVPNEPVINIIQNKFANDKNLHQRTSITIHHIISLLEFFLKNTYFVFQGNFYEQKEGTAMGSPLSPIIANIFMEDFKTKGLSSAPHPLSLWKRFVDDTFVVIKQLTKKYFFNHINSIEEDIHFTAKNTRADGSMPFLDTLVTPQADGSMLTTVYRKPTHANQYLQWDSHHAMSAKYSVISTLFHRAKEVCCTKQHLEEEHEHLQKALTSCKYPS